MARFQRILAAAALVVALLLVPAAARAESPALVGQWPLDEAPGDVTPDLSSSGAQGALTGGATIIPDGRFGGALHLGVPLNPGYDPGVIVRDAPVLEPPQVTATAWVRHAGDPGSYKWLLAKGAAGCNGASYGFTTGADDGLYFSVYDGTGAHGTVNAGASLWDGQWHAVALRRV